MGNTCCPTMGTPGLGQIPEDDKKKFFSPCYHIYAIAEKTLQQAILKQNQMQQE
jgi:hypothetical protein